MNILKILTAKALAAMVMLCLLLSVVSCSDDDPDDNGGSSGGSTEAEGPDVSANAPDRGIHTLRAPLYWSVYERCWLMERQGIPGDKMDITADQWDEIINWMAVEMLPYGYNMLCTDGFISMHVDSPDGIYLERYGSMPLADLVKRCKAKGLKLGVYDNPLWIHCPNERIVPGTNVSVGSLRYQPGSDKVVHSSASDTWFHWIVASHQGAKEYIDGFFKHYHDLGVDFIRVDFLSWYEDGNDRGMGTVGRGYGRDCYELALKYMCESATKYGIFLSLVMPHCYKSAELEAKYGHMFRIVRDTAAGGWDFCSNSDRRLSYGNWPNCNNQFDGFVYWSKVAGRGSVIMDGDFTRLNTFENDAQKESEISLQLMAGGPIAIADQPSTIGNNARFYQNSEMLALNADRFAGRPLAASLIDNNNQIWYGQMRNGDWVVGFFNRDAVNKSFSLKFSSLGLSGTFKIRDLWRHADEGAADHLDVTLNPYACKIVRLSK